MRVRHALVPAALVLALAVAPASAQVLPTPGSTVRITSEAEPNLMVGQVSSVEAGGIEIVDEGGNSHFVDLSSVRRLEVLERRRNTWRGAFIGAGAGLIVGLIASSSDQCEGETLGFCEAFEGAAEGVATVIYTLVGGGVGAIVGSRIVSSRWTDAQVMQPGSHQFSLGLRIPLSF